MWEMMFKLHEFPKTNLFSQDMTSQRPGEAAEGESSSGFLGS